MLDRVRKIFNENYVVNALTGCWIWTGPKHGGRSGTGYGQMTRKELGPAMPAHRASWILNRGPIPDGVMVCHKCDNRICVNPDHLYLGTNADNMRDRSQRGYVHQMRLDEAKVREMRQLRQQGWSWRKLAARYGVHHNAVVDATMGRSWAYVDEPIPTIVIGPGRRKVK
jgi:hypothetical protein